MTAPRPITLSIFDREPAFGAGVQAWKGGATDLAARTMIAARRFRAGTGQPRHVAPHHVENTGIHATPGWMAANETPWIRRIRRFRRDRICFMFRERTA